MKKVRPLCLKDGFNIKSFASNGVDLLRVIPNDLRKDGMKDKDLKLGTLIDDKALGVQYNVKNDTLGFIVKMSYKPATRRALFTALSSIYDLLGFGCTFLVERETNNSDTVQAKHKVQCSIR